MSEDSTGFEMARGSARMATVLLIFTLTQVPSATFTELCQSSGGGRMHGLWGDALTGDLDCAGPDGRPYPRALVDSLVKSLTPKRRGKSLFKVEDPMDTQRMLLSSYALAQQVAGNDQRSHRYVRAAPETTTDKESKQNKIKVEKDKSNSTKSSGISETVALNSTLAPATVSVPPSCSSVPSRLCKTRYNTTAPMYGVSLTSGNPVTIVQKFPDLLQQVIFEVCESDACDVVHGKCVQTYTPHLFLVIPLGPVTLTGQDYVLVESGCVCQPKYTQNTQHTTLPDFKP